MLNEGLVLTHRPFAVKCAFEGVVGHIFENFFRYVEKKSYLCTQI